MKTVKTTAVLLMLIVFSVSTLFATGAKEIIEQENNQELVAEVLEEIKEDRIHYATVDKEDMVSYSKSAFGMDVLVADKMKCSAKYPDILMDEAGLDDIMVFYVNQKQA